MSARLALGDTEADLLASLLCHVGGSQDGLALVAERILSALVDEHGARPAFGHLLSGSIKIAKESEMA